MAHLNRFVNKLHTSMPDLSAEDMADMLWLSLHMGSQPDTPDAASDDTVGDMLGMPDISALFRTEKGLHGSDPKPVEGGEGNKPPDPELVEGGEGNKQASQQAGLYANAPRDAGDDASLLAFSTPGAAALPGKLELARSLRPLKRRVESHTTTAVDEDATVQRIADEGLWVPALRPAKVRWLDVALVVDSAASVQIWQQAILELRRLLAHHGAFRDVRIWELVTDDDDGTLHLYAGYGSNSSASANAKGASPRQRERNPRELIDPSGRRLVLLISDCVSAAWRNGSIATNLLALWGRYNLVTVVHVLPDSLWSRTALGMEMDVLCYAPSPCRPNQYLRYDEPQVFFGERVQHGMCLPVVTLEPDTLAAWVHLVLGNEDVRIPGFVLPTMPDAPPSNSPSPPGPPARRGEMPDSPPCTGGLGGDLVSSESDSERPTLERGLGGEASERVTRFYVTASATAFKLAGLLSAAAPLNLHIMRLVQQAMLPESRQVHLAEVFLSGLLRPIHLQTPHEAAQAQDPDYVPYDFYAGVREELQASVLVPDSMQVLAIVSDYIGRHMGHPVGFSALLAEDPEALARLADEEYRPFARVAASLLRRMGGRYAELAGRITSRDVVYNVSTNGEAVSSQPQDARGGALFPVTIAEWREELQHLSTTFGQPQGYWCYVQPGTYRIGGWEKGRESANITLPAFWIAKHPITVAQYWQFMDSGGYNEERWWTPNGWEWKNRWKRTQPYSWKNAPYNSAEDQTVNGSSWYEAIAFANWLNEQLTEEFPDDYCLCLPTEAEWEVAAAYDVNAQRHTYTWGEDEPTTERAVYEETGAEAPAQVGNRPDGAAACGAQDMVGNVWEWTTSSYKGYPDKSDTMMNDFEVGSWDVSIRGASYYDNRIHILCATRDGVYPNKDYYLNRGFRLILSLCLRKG